MLDLFEIRGDENSEWSSMVFGTFTSEELANAAHKAMPEEFRAETSVGKCALPLNAIEIDNQVIDMTSVKTPEEIIASRDEDNYVTGYVQLHISDVIDNDNEGFLNLLSESLVGNELLMDIQYDVVATTNNDEIIFKVTGDVSSILDDEE